MKRRQFLAAAAALAVAPAFLRRAFGDESCRLPARPALPASAYDAAALARAWKQALQNGRALLVLVIPEDDGQKWDRGAAFGELLNHGSDSQLAPLSAVEVVCATMADLRTLVPSVGTGEPLLVHVDPAHVPATVRRLDAALPPYDRTWRGGVDYKEMVAEEDRIADRRIAILAALVAQVGPADPSRAAEVRARLAKKRVPGSHWANASGCGTSVEDDDDPLMVACGMGHVPEKSSRFLYLYAQTPGEQRRAQRRQQAEKQKP